ncbi:MAG: MBL fold metallo-hydrolase [Sulfurimonadaceae bacterium]|nr:MBL fold metallo-hydrolase [Sulfurimonadaceae bacterium]
MNEITILGAYGTRSKGFGTSSFLINDTNVIDAGNILNTLEEKAAHIEHIWLTHSHLDHISDIAYVLDNYFSARKKTLKIYGLRPTLRALRKHFFNDLIWPDFSNIALVNSTEMALSYHEIELRTPYILDATTTLEAFRTDHTVPSCGYIVKKNSSMVLITADTHDLSNAIELIESRKEITAVVLECSFPSYLEQLAVESKHLTPKLLFEKLNGIKRDDFTLYINHIKPTYLEIITREIAQYCGKWEANILKDEEIITF